MSCAVERDIRQGDKHMTNYVINSAVITTPGHYTYRLITPQYARLMMNSMKTPWISTIGYEASAEGFNQVVKPKEPITMNRINMNFKPGDKAIVFRLKRRVEAPENKSKVPLEYILENYELGLLRMIEYDA